jgi:hypothetical protein
MLHPAVLHARIKSDCDVSRASDRPVSSMALAISFLRFLKNAPWLSKDVILLLAHGNVCALSYCA